MEIRKLTRLIEKTVGVAFKDQIEPVYFETRWGIHTFFVRQPIDVIILDDKFIVRKIVRNLLPGKFLFWDPKYFRVIEFAAKDKRYPEAQIGKKLNIKYG